MKCLFISSKVKSLKLLNPGREFFLIIGDTGIEASTKKTVSKVRKNWEKEPGLMNGYFDEIERITENGKKSH